MKMINVKIVMCTFLAINGLPMHGMMAPRYSQQASQTWRSGQRARVTQGRGYESPVESMSEIQKEPSLWDRAKAWWNKPLEPVTMRQPAKFQSSIIRPGTYSVTQSHPIPGSLEGSTYVTTTEYPLPQKKGGRQTQNLSGGFLMYPTVAQRRHKEYKRQVELAMLRRKKAEYIANLDNMENEQAYEMAYYPTAKIFSNNGIKNTTDRMKLELENLEVKISAKAPSKKEVVLLRKEKQQLIANIERLKQHEEYMRQTNPHAVDSELIGGARQNDVLRLDTINTQLKKYERLQAVPQRWE